MKNQRELIQGPNRITQTKAEYPIKNRCSSKTFSNVEGLASFLCLIAYQPHGLFNVKSILVEDQQ